jgi:hypothetical protein
MAVGPDPDPPLVIHVHVNSPPPQRTRVRVGWLLLIPLWPLVLFGWLIWLALTCLLTLVGIVVMAGGLVIWGTGLLIALRWPDAGGGVVAVGRGTTQGTAHAIDVMNGHGSWWSSRRRD